MTPLLRRLCWVLAGMVPLGVIGGLLGLFFGMWGLIPAVLLGSLYGQFAIAWAYRAGGS